MVEIEDASTTGVGAKPPTSVILSSSDKRRLRIEELRAARDVKQNENAAKEAARAAVLAARTEGASAKQPFGKTASISTEPVQRDGGVSSGSLSVQNSSQKVAAVVVPGSVRVSGASISIEDEADRAIQELQARLLRKSSSSSETDSDSDGGIGSDRLRALMKGSDDDDDDQGVDCNNLGTKNMLEPASLSSTAQPAAAMIQTSGDGNSIASPTMETSRESLFFTKSTVLISAETSESAGAVSDETELKCTAQRNQLAHEVSSSRSILEDKTFLAPQLLFEDLPPIKSQHSAEVRKTEAFEILSGPLADLAARRTDITVTEIRPGMAGVSLRCRVEEIEVLLRYIDDEGITHAVSEWRVADETGTILFKVKLACLLCKTWLSKCAIGVQFDRSSLFGVCYTDTSASISSVAAGM